MKPFTSTYLLLLGILAFTIGCTNLQLIGSRDSTKSYENRKIDSTQMERRVDGLFYERGKKHPFTGDVLTYYPDGATQASKMSMRKGSLLNAKCWSPVVYETQATVKDGYGTLKTFYYPNGEVKTKTLVSDSVFKSVEFFDKNVEILKSYDLNFGRPIPQGLTSPSRQPKKNKDRCFIHKLFHPDHAVFEMTPPEQEARWSDLLVGPLGITEMLLELPTAIFREENKKGHWKDTE